MWPAVHTRPDIAYLVEILSQYCGNLRPIYCLLIIQIFCYFANTLNLRITFQANSNNGLVGYINFDYVGLVNGRKSTKRYIFMLSSGAFSHQSKHQNTVALSSIKAKYMAA